MSDPVLPHFPTGVLLTVRPAAGGRRALVVVEEQEQAVGRVWDQQTGELSPVLPFEVGFDSVLSPDGAWVVGLDDDGGSEVGGLVARSFDGAQLRSLTPGRTPYVLRGLEFTPDGRHVLATVVDEDGHHLLLIPFDDAGASRLLFSSEDEAWFGHVSADGRYASIDTTDHNPGVRRAAVTVLATADGRHVGVADDLPAGPVRAVRFSSVPGDPRVLLSTERSGFARPAIWDPMTGDRRDYELPDLAGEVLVLDWDAEAGTLLLVEAGHGLHRLLLLDEATGESRVVREGGGSFAEPDVASVFPYYSQSFLGPGGRPVVLESSWTTPLHLWRETATGAEVIVPAVEVPAGIPLASVMVQSADGTSFQLWWAAPPAAPRGTVLYLHGGPNLVTLDRYRPDLQAWLDAGYAVAALNYRGSVTFGRAFREGFWGSAGDREIADIEAGLSWLRAQGLADPATTFVTGHSFGGHLSLLTAGRLPGTIAGALAIVAMADWEAAWDEMNPALRKTWTSFLSLRSDGTIDPSRIPQTLKRFSSINYVETVRASVWLYQGGRDTRTPPEQARRYAERLAAAGGDVLVEWFDAGHEPTGTQAVLHEFERSLELAEARLAGAPWHHLGEV